MGAADGSIGEALARVAESFGRLVAQHLQLLRTELETEARDLSQRARTGGQAIGRALPFAIAGLVLLSWGVAEAVALLLWPLVGALARPLAFVVLGAAETVAAASWLKRSLEAASAKGPVLPARDDHPEAGPQAHGETAPGIRGPSAKDGEEMRYGAVGRG